MKWTCPLCDEVYGTEQCFMDHLVRRHWGTAGRFSGRRALCACGKGFLLVPPEAYSARAPGPAGRKQTLAEHLAERGGIEAHLLEVQLGLCDNGSR